MYCPTSVRSAPLLHGIKYESVAVEKFEKVDGGKTETCGLFVCKDHSCLAASPDSLIDDFTLVEVKCPFASIKEEITPITVPYLKEEEGNLCLDRKDHYYCQVQGQMHCSGRRLCKLVVFTLEDMKVVPVKYDPSFVQAMVEKLEEIYTDTFKDVLINYHLYKEYDKHDFSH